MPSKRKRQADEEVFEVERIQGKRVRKRCTQYLVKWVGHAQCTWEPRSNLSCDQLVEEFENSRRKHKNNRKSHVEAIGAQQEDRVQLEEQESAERSAGEKEAVETHSLSTHAQVCADAPHRELETEDSNQVAPTTEHSTRSGMNSLSVAPALSADIPTRREAISTVLPRHNSPSAKGGLERSYLGKLGAYSPQSDKWLSHSSYNVVGSAYIVGRICDYHYAKKRGLYEIRWLDSIFQARAEKVDIAVIKQGRANYDRLEGQRDTPHWRRLCEADPSDILDIDDDLEDLVEYKEFEAPNLVPVSVSEVEEIKSMRFEPNEVIRAPESLFKHRDGGSDTRVKAEYKHIFEHSASSSFFAYLPLSYWKQVLVHMNALAEAKDIKIKEPFVIHELMQFLGILWFMEVVDKGEFSNYWGDQMESAIFDTGGCGLDSVMPLRRFKQMRSAFCFRQPTEITAEDLKRDSAARIRSLINMLKQTSSKYVDVGRNLAVDEASVASRSKFARHLIVYNPRKPTGKYHFKFYMTCCATSWIALNFRLHGDSSLGDRTSGILSSSESRVFEDELSAAAKTRQIVLEITRPYFYSNRIVNCDNYYTSVQLIEALRVKGLFCRGTVKRVSKHFPRHVVLGEPRKIDRNANKNKQKQIHRNTLASATEDAQLVDTTAVDPTAEPVTGEVRRGDYRQAVCVQHQILAASWCDGNVVTIVSNADASTVSTVSRLVKGQQCEIPAPTCIKEYNQHMQGVDRNDQLRARFSVSDGHSFKKWHKKLGLAIIDLARVNAFLTRRLCLNDKSKDRDSHRCFMIDLIKEMISGKWQEAPYDEGMLFDEAGHGVPPRTTRSPQTSYQSPAHLFSPASSQLNCVGVESSQVFQKNRRRRMCAICRLECRKNTVLTEYCVSHKLCLCKRVHRDTRNPFGCQNSEWTCWEKYHLYYLPKNVFSANGCIRRGSEVYKERKWWLEQLANQAQANDLASEYETPVSHRALTFDGQESDSSFLAYEQRSSLSSAQTSFDFTS